MSHPVETNKIQEPRKTILEKERLVCQILYHQDHSSYRLARPLLSLLLREVGEDPHRAQILDRQAVCYRLLSEWDNAEKAAREAVQVSTIKHGLLGAEPVRLRLKLCQLLSLRPKPEKQERKVDPVLAYYNSLCNGAAGTTPGIEAALLLEHGQWLLASGEFEEAREALMVALPQLVAASDRLGAGYAASAARGLGDIYFRRCEYRLAKSYYDQAVSFDTGLAAVLRQRLADLACELEPTWPG